MQYRLSETSPGNPGTAFNHVIDWLFPNRATALKSRYLRNIILLLHLGVVPCWFRSTSNFPNPSINTTLPSTPPSYIPNAWRNNPIPIPPFYHRSSNLRMAPFSALWCPRLFPIPHCLCGSCSLQIAVHFTVFTALLGRFPFLTLLRAPQIHIPMINLLPSNMGWGLPFFPLPRSIVTLPFDAEIALESCCHLGSILYRSRATCSISALWRPSEFFSNMWHSIS